MDKNSVKNLPKLELLNSEGPILVAYKEHDDLYYIFDTKKILVSILNLEGLISFFEGKHIILDSSGKSWNYVVESGGMKRPDVEIKMFLNQS
jgi:hypothetical protein